MHYQVPWLSHKQDKDWPCPFDFDIVEVGPWKSLKVTDTVSILSTSLAVVVELCPHLNLQKNISKLNLTAKNEIIKKDKKKYTHKKR